MRFPITVDKMPSYHVAFRELWRSLVPRRIKLLTSTSAQLPASLQATP
jgi:hypothetical protein